MNSTFRSKLLPPVEVRGAPLIAMVSALGLAVEAMQRLEVKVEGGKVPKNGGLDEFWCKLGPIFGAADLQRNLC